MLNIIRGFLTPENGSVKVDGQNISENISAWQQKIGYIPQDIYLADQSIKRNITFGYKDSTIDETKIKQSLQMAHLYDFVYGLPQKADTVIGEHGVRLSGGQRQRIGIARALYHNPEILALDKATASLDTTTEKSVMQALNDAQKGRTFIMIAHRLSTVKNCDVIFCSNMGISFLRERTIIWPYIAKPLSK